MTDRDLEERFPWIEWRKPVAISRGGQSGFACRYCVAHNGFGPDDELRPLGTVKAHIRKAHSR